MPLIVLLGAGIACFLLIIFIVRQTILATRRGGRKMFLALNAPRGGIFETVDRLKGRALVAVKKGEEYVDTVQETCEARHTDPCTHPVYFVKSQVVVAAFADQQDEIEQAISTASIPVAWLRGEDLPRVPLIPVRNSVRSLVGAVAHDRSLSGTYEAIADYEYTILFGWARPGDTCDPRG